MKTDNPNKFAINGEVRVPLEIYNELIWDQKQLRALEAGGVDNWEWYGDTMEEFWEEKNKWENERLK